MVHLSAMAVLVFVFNFQVFAHSNCTTVVVNGGDTHSGTYHSLPDAEEGSQFIREVDNLTSYIQHYEFGSERRKLGETNEADAVPDGNLLGERPGFSEAVAETAKARANALASCGDTWFMRGNDDELVQVFPFYFVVDCADHPADISEEWYKFECDNCDEEVALDVTISCQEDAVLATSAASRRSPVGPSFEAGLLAGVAIAMSYTTILFG